jgi:hypothetical protein
MLKPDISEADAKYAKWILYRYKISARQYNTILKRQESQCALCKSDSPRSKNNRFVVDHCHSTGRIRGLLCLPCNTALGQLGDTPESLLAAISYIAGADDGLVGAAKTSGIDVRVTKIAGRRNLVLIAPAPATGKRIWKTSGTDDAVEAQRLADLWTAELLLGRMSKGKELQQCGLTSNAARQVTRISTSLNES